jgi:DNA repair protein RadC
MGDARYRAQRRARGGPRQRLLRFGVGGLSDVEVLAMLLGPDQSGAPAQALARRLIDGSGGLQEMLHRDPSALLAEFGMGPARLGRLMAARELSRRAAEEPLRRTAVMSSPRQTRAFLQRHLGGREREVFCCLFLDAQHRLRCCEDLFLGTLDGAAVYPREVVTGALRHRAAAVILAHNHPSGIASPSGADRQITERLVAALALVDVRVLDHLIIGRGCSFSFAEAGLL